MKSKRDIIIVTVCVLAAITCIALVFSGNVNMTGNINAGSVVPQV